MKRRLFNFAAAASLVLCLATLGMWLRSYWVGDELRRDAYSVTSGTARHAALEFHSGAGGFAATLMLNSNGDPALIRTPAQLVPPGSAWSWRADDKAMYPALRWAQPASAVRLWSRAGFGFAVSPRRQSGYFAMQASSVLLPDWAIAAATAMLPLAWLLARQRRLWKESRIGCCERCGYNLTGNASGVCPECGTPVINGPRAAHAV